MSGTVGILPYSRFNKWLVDFGVSRVSQQLDATCKSLSRRFQHLSQQQTSSRTFGIYSNHRRPVRWRSGARYISFIPKRHLTLTSGARLCSKDYFMHLKFQVMFGRIPLLKLHLIFLNPMFFKWKSMKRTQCPKERSGSERLAWWMNLSAWSPIFLSFKHSQSWQKEREQ